MLEIGGRSYVDRFGVSTTEPAPGKVHRVDVLHVDASNPEATIVGSLTDLDTLPADTFDCIICTQTLHVIYDVETAVRMLHRALRPGGTVLVTVPGITASCRPDRDHWGDWWRFTEGSSRRLFADVFGAARSTSRPTGTSPPLSPCSSGWRQRSCRSIACTCAIEITTC